MGRAVAALCALVVGAGCGGSDPRSDPSVSPQRCAPPSTSPVRGDVDGDGGPDDVSILLRTADSGCQYELSVGAHLERLDQPAATPPPAVVGLARIDASGGLEIVVRTLGGASTATASVFGLRHGELERFGVSGVGTSLAYGMGGGGAVAVDCLGGQGSARVRAQSFSRAVDGPMWILRSQTDYVLRNGTFVRTAETRPEVQVRASTVSKRAEVALRSCIVVSPR